MTTQEYFLQQYIMESFKKMGIKYINPQTQEDETIQTIKKILKENKDLRNQIIDDFSDIIVKHFELDY